MEILTPLQPGIMNYSHRNSLEPYWNISFILQNYFKEIGDWDIVIATFASLLLPSPSFSASEFELYLLHYISKELYFL